MQKYKRIWIIMEKPCGFQAKKADAVVLASAVSSFNRLFYEKHLSFHEVHASAEELVECFAFEQSVLQ